MKNKRVKHSPTFITLTAVFSHLQMLKLQRKSPD